MVSVGFLRKCVIGGGVVCSLYGGYVLLDDKRRRSRLEVDMTPIKTLENPSEKVFLVTGTTSGIGKSLAFELAAQKCKVFMLCRDMESCEVLRERIVLSTKNKYVYCRECDLNSQNSIKNFAEAFNKTGLGIDGLCNNAGIMNLKQKELTEEGIEKQFGVNHLGHFYLTKLLEDAIKKVKGRIVYLLSLEYRLGDLCFEDINFTKTREYNPEEAFRQSQVANMMFIQEYSKTEGLTINAAFPGVCATNITRNMDIGKSFVGRHISRPLLNWFAFGADVGARVPLKLLVDPALNGVSGALHGPNGELTINSNSKNEINNKRLVLMNEYWTKLKNKEDLAKLNVKIKSNSQ